MRTTHVLLALASALAASPAVAQAFKGPNPFLNDGGDGGGGKGGMDYRACEIAMPIVSMTREAVLHVEFNLAGKATLALEGMLKGAYEEVGDDKREETGESRQSTGKGLALLVARYSDPIRMAGFYWSLGAGYREESVKWQVQPEEKDKQVDWSLVQHDDESDRDYLHHDAALKGTTGHLRAGYRYVASDVPLSIGGYVGARHFQAGVKDADPKKQADDDESEDVTYAPMTQRERDRLRRNYATRPEAGLEIGFSF